MIAFTSAYLSVLLALEFTLGMCTIVFNDESSTS